MQGMNFGMDGPSITGWWVNPKTGDKFNAVDTYFEDNNLLIKTSDGRLLNYNQVQNYIQTNDPNSVTPQKSQPVKKETIPVEVLNELDNGMSDGNDLLIPDDNIYGIPKQPQAAELGNIYDVNPPAKKPPIKDYDIICRALNEKERPEITANIKWKNFPKREVEMLIDVMDIAENNIIQYYINNIDINDVRCMVADGIQDFIYRELHGGRPQPRTELDPGINVAVKEVDIPKDKDEIVDAIKKKKTTKKK